MSHADYKPVRKALPETLPAITRVEAEKAVKRLYRKFGKLDNGYQMTRYTWSRGVRRCWISTKPTSGHWKGWGRLIHDVSHNIFARTYPNKLPHDPLHVHYETKIAEYVAGTDWLDGGLKPKVKPKPTKEEKRLAEIVRTKAALKRWNTKQSRAQTAIKKYNTKLKRLEAAGV